jgi:hypothetical protein
MDGLSFLLEMNGQLVNRDDGYWYKIEAYQVELTKYRPHGIRYNLTLHDKYNRRIFGIDNAHGVKLPKKGRFTGSVYQYDHQHKSATDKGSPYEFKDCYQLVTDFFEGIDKTIESIQK